MNSTNSRADRHLSLPILASLHIAEPCPLADQAWQPGQRSRHCAECDLDVHNFSAMSALDAAALVEQSHETGARLCASYERDAAGNVVTLDFRAARHPSARSNRPHSLMRLLAALGLMSSPIAFAACSTRMGGKVVSPAQHMGGSTTPQPLGQSAACDSSSHHDQ